MTGTTELERETTELEPQVEAKAPGGAEGGDDDGEDREVWVVVYSNGAEKKIFHPEGNTTDDAFKQYQEAAKKGHHFALGKWLIDTRSVVSFGLLSQEVEEEDGVDELAEEVEEFKRETAQNVALLMEKVAEHEEILQSEIEEEIEEEEEAAPPPQPKPLKMGAPTKTKGFKPPRG